ncbi:DUF2637 domain-containing protein [Streptomyces sp. DH8]|uniref:DUF2637 domain-containing protein n=1 Tax=Streptomyces sp. DH8 TaxID=2857008 RepID=UPI001E5EFA1E|nr:DUF2637 domain-containing protein [Streptomyces sp. DH8]
MTTTPAPQPPTSPHGRTLPTAGDTAPNDERAMKAIIWTAVICALVLAAIGFVGSYTAVRKLAEEKDFGSFSHAFPIGIDAGIIVFLALDLILCHKRMPLPPLRWVAWALTAATVFYNASAGDKGITEDPLAAAMHATIPILFIGSAEAARHYIARLAQITADKHIDGVPLTRWLVAPLSSLRIWRRMRLWNIRSYETVINLEQEVRIYRAQLKKEHGRRWRRKAGADQILVLELAASGMSVAEAIDLPYREAQKRTEAEAKRNAEARAEAEAKREAEVRAELEATKAEAKRRAELAEAEAAEAEARTRSEAAAEVARLEVEAKRRAETEAARLLVAETEAKLATIARAEEAARSEAELKRRQQQAEVDRLNAEQQARDAEAQAEAARQARETKAREEAQRLTAEAATRSETTSASTPASDAGTRSASTSGSAPRSIAPQRGKRQSEVEAVLARIVATGDPKSVSLEDVMNDFDLKQTTAYDRLKTAQDLYAARDLKSQTA